VKWNVYKFTKVGERSAGGNYELLGQVDGEHQPAAWKTAANRWPVLAKSCPEYPNARLVLRPEGDTRGMPGFTKR
jgi:hypothetical protein